MTTESETTEQSVITSKFFNIEVEEIDRNDFRIKRESSLLKEKKEELRKIIDNLVPNTGITINTSDMSFNAIKTVVNRFNQDGIKSSPKKNARMLLLENTEGKVVGVKIARMD